jgi:hypothetical protein
VPQARGGRFQTGMTAEGTPDQDDWFGARGALNQPRECSSVSLRPPEIVGEVTNPALETVRRFWWRAFDSVCGCTVLIRLSTRDRISGPEPPTLPDEKREADEERLVGHEALQ